SAGGGAGNYRTDSSVRQNRGVNGGRPADRVGHATGHQFDSPRRLESDSAPGDRHERHAGTAGDCSLLLAGGAISRSVRRAETTDQRHSRSGKGLGRRPPPAETTGRPEQPRRDGTAAQSRPARFGKNAAGPVSGRGRSGGDAA